MGAPDSASEFQDLFGALRAEIGKLIVGHGATIDQLLVCLFTGGHALIEGVPGLGKTQLVKTLGRCFDLELSRIQFTPDLMPADIVGTNVIRESTVGREFRFEPGPLFGHLVLADEINRATPKTQSALLEAMQEGGVTVGGERHALPQPFFVLATQNPIEIEGTYALPEAQLDRFMFKLEVGFPDLAEIETIVDRTTSAHDPEIEAVATGEQIERLKPLVRDVVLPEQVKRYIGRLLLATHPEHESSPDVVKRFVRYGASPRGAQALVLGGKVLALEAGRFNVGFADVRAVAAPALRHRLILNFEGEAEGVTADTIVEALVGSVVEEAA